MANVIPQTEAYMKSNLVTEFYDDFHHEIDTTNVYTATLTDTGTATVGNGAGGILPLIPSDGTVADNDEAYLGMRNLVFSMTANKPIVAYGKAQFTEANTDDANIALGLCSTVGANTLIDDGGGPIASGTHFCIFKVDGGTVWKCESRNQTVVLTNTTAVTAGGADYFTWEVEINEILTTHAVVNFRVNGEYLKDATSGLIITHRIVYASSDALTPFAAVKNGGANLETLNLQYLGCVQAR